MLCDDGCVNQGLLARMCALAKPASPCRRGLVCARNNSVCVVRYKLLFGPKSRNEACWWVI